MSVARVIAIMVFVVVAGCLSGSDPQPPAPQDTPGPPSSAGPSIPTSGAPSSSGSPAIGGGLRLVPGMVGLESPLLVTHAGDGSGRLFVVEQAGTIRVTRLGTSDVGLYADLRDRVGSAASEQGLLGLAFLPGDANVVFVSYTDKQGDSVVSRFREQNGALDPQSEERLLFVDQPFDNHNGGHLAFGPDGMLYFGLGDGGFAGDPAANGQNPATLLGSMLRLQVGATGPYTIPADNPFADHPLFAPETWSYGWRNPWRFSFDRATGDLWIADVGQNVYEEIDFEPAGSPGGGNYGWNLFEGNHHYPTGVDAAPLAEVPLGFVFPLAEYAHDPGGHCSVTGGYVYRGALNPDLVGAYVYGDYCSGIVWTLRAGGQPQQLMDLDAFISSFGEDEAGELYVASYAAGTVLRFENG